VHRLPEDPSDRSVPDQGRCALVVYRDPENNVRFLELTPLAAAIAERLFAGRSLGAAMTEACEAERVARAEEVLAGAAGMLADWGERGLLLGARG
jgi:hypothetical protein